MMNCDSVEDEFELFKAQSYGVESVLRHQRAASVRSSTKTRAVPSPGDIDVKVKVNPGTQGDLARQSPEITPQPRPAAERKASFKSSARRRIYQQRIPEEVIIGDDQTTSGRRDMDADGGDGVVRPLRDANEGHSAAVDDSELARQRADVVDVDDDVTTTSQDTCRVYRMRSFYTKSGNIVNRGDSMRTRTPTSGSARRTRDVTNAVPSTGSSINMVLNRAPAKQCEGRSTTNDAPCITTCQDPSRQDHLTVGYTRISTSGHVFLLPVPGAVRDWTVQTSPRKMSRQAPTEYWYLAARASAKLSWPNSWWPPNTSPTRKASPVRYFSFIIIVVMMIMV